MYKIVLLRHGESEWNKENRFTGWTDVDLNETGEAQAQKAGKMLLEKGYAFDVAYTSYLKRAIRTMWLALTEMNLAWIPDNKSWRLNERHYGALQGLNKADTAEKYGEEQVKIWRRSYDTPPPRLEDGDERLPERDPRYAGIPQDEMPRGESLKDTIARVMPYWESEIVPAIRSGKQVLVVAHGNSLRAIVQHLDNLDEATLLELNIPVGQPLVYELDEELRPTAHYYLASADEIAAEMAAVANQGKASA